MSRFRLTAKVRKNADYIALSRFLDDLGLPHEVVQPNAKGHPALRITLPTGTLMDHHIACTPRGWCNAPARVAALRRKLIEAGALAKPHSIV
ncbi:hypothetical protein [Paracoccus hibiscisoli]|uniref:Uncharacterized protein n=1 Tax=Paracoccus hibiscisoli TaxID=2023261 RepID=A0A4V5MTW6_9RHOB|nr:hypothetical protein [Paracoccus hibiscisoli]TJZ85818.1 hypothetical protein FA740_05305 [Paracoccus hibiscisoli]